MEQRERGSRDSRGGSRGEGRGGRTYGGGRGGDAKGKGYDREGKGRFLRKKVCRLCAERIASIDYKDTERLLKFLTEKGKILPQRISGNCAKHQRMLARVVKRARHVSLIAFEIGV